MNIAFCFIVKDGEKYLEKNLSRIINIGEKFNSYKIFYAENDSLDSTREILEKISYNNKNLSGISLKLDGKHSTDLCKSSDNYNCFYRTQRLAYLRNKVLNLAKEWNDCNIMIMLDLDFIDFDEKEFMNMITIIWNNEKINAIFGMSVTEKDNNCLYDIGAIEPQYKIIDIIEDELVNVSSAFSGVGIYKMKIIKDNNISYKEDTNSIEHIDFNKQMNNLFVYTKFRPIYEGTGSLYFFNNRKYIYILLLFLLIIFIILGFVIFVFYK